MAYNSTQTRRLEQGLCPLCGGERDADRKRLICGICIERQSARQSRVTGQRAVAGQCTICGGKRDDRPRRICLSCRAERNIKLGERQMKLQKDGKCISCGIVLTETGVRCIPCRERGADKVRAYRGRLRISGRCRSCGGEPSATLGTATRNICERCYFKNVANGRLGSTIHWDAISAKLEEQNHRCAYTGEELVLGKNDSLDHIMPSSRFPELACDPGSVQWVTRRVNMMKLDLTHDEFIEIISRIVRNLKI